MDNYVYFRKRSHFSCLANTSVQVSDALTAANFGIVPADFTAASATDAAQGLEVVLYAKSAAGFTRGTAITALNDFNTGLAFGLGSTVFSGQASHLTWDAMGIADGVLTIANFAADGADGYLINAADNWIIREYVGSTNNALTDVPAPQQRGCFNMNHYLGCDPVDTATAAVIGVDVDGTEVEKTRIIFRGGDGGTTADYVVLTHAVNKFKDVCAAMEELANGNYRRNGKGIYTFTDLISSGGSKVTKYENELGIVGCHIVAA